MTVIARTVIGRINGEGVTLEEFSYGCTVSVASGGLIKSITYTTYAEALDIYLGAVGFMSDRERARR